jgi:hypothetical protein
LKELDHSSWKTPPQVNPDRRLPNTNTIACFTLQNLTCFVFVSIYFSANAHVEIDDIPALPPINAIPLVEMALMPPACAPSDANGTSNTNARAREQWSSRNVGKASQDAIRALTAPNVDAIGTDLVTARLRGLEYTSNTTGLLNCHLRALQSVSPEASQQAIREKVNCNDHDRVTEILAEHVSEDDGRVIQLRRFDKRNIERHWVSITPDWYTDDANCFVTNNYAGAVAVLEMLEYSEKDFGGMTTSVEAMLVNPNSVRPVGVTTRVQRRAASSANTATTNAQAPKKSPIDETSALVPSPRRSPRKSGKRNESSDIIEGSQRQLDLYMEKRRVRLCFFIIE